MRSSCFLALLLACAGPYGWAKAGGPLGLCRPWTRCPTCPHDYCRKPLPITSTTHACGPNDYCRKPRPITGPVKCFFCNDYRPKPLPVVPCCYPPWYTCGPGCK